MLTNSGQYVSTVGPMADAATNAGGCVRPAQALDVNLNAGANTFKFSFRTGFAELDSIDLVMP